MAEQNDSLTSESTPPAKKAKRECHFDKEWAKDFPGIKSSSKGQLTQLSCEICISTINNICRSHIC